jgi:hypothetical protein
VPDTLTYIIKGVTESGATIEIDEEVFEVEEDGRFSIEFEAEEDIHEIEMKAIDPAGNITSRLVHI